MGDFDITADTAVGTGLVIGLTGGGTLPLWAGLLAIVVFGGLFVAGNLAAAMLLQLTGFLPALYIFLTDRPEAWWLPYLTIIVIAILDWRRLVFVNIPNFLSGIRGRFEH